ncbi:MAG TPA: TolC family protein [Planctomycetaceae bacterium]|nr:TolC family protein [Planctomycetaceae bacterium]
MTWTRPQGWVRSIGRALLAAACLTLAWTLPNAVYAQVQQAPDASVPPAPPSESSGPSASFGGSDTDRRLPINLATAFTLAGVQPIDVQVAAARIRVAAAELDYAKLLWLPSLLVGTDYLRHDGQIQDSAGNITTTSFGSFMLGTGPTLVVGVTDAIFEPLAARHVVQARDAALQTALNDSLLAVADAYFTVQEARGELAGAEDVVRRSVGLVYRVQRLAPALFADFEVVRTRTQAKRSRQLVQSARERWRVTSADLTRILQLDSSAVVEPIELPNLQVTLVGLDQPLEEMIGIGLTSRPELAGQQALVQQTLARIRQEKLRPFLPNIQVVGNSTPQTTFAGGLFGGGPNDTMGSFGSRFDVDVELVWELKELGFGNQALIRQREAENDVARFELVRTQNTVAAQVAQAYAQAKSAALRATEAEAELKDAVASANKNVQALSQTKNAGGNILIPLVRPQEVVASLQALWQAYLDYYGAVADFNRAQFRLYHALGHPAQAVANQQFATVPPPPQPASAPSR